MQSFNLSKFARGGVPTAFTTDGRDDPYRLNSGKPGKADSSDKLRAGNVPSAFNGSSGGGQAWSTNKEWPSDTPMITNFEGRPNELHGEGIVSDYGLSFHDDYEGQNGDASGESPLGRNSTVSRMIDDDSRDKKPYNISDVYSGGLLRSLRKRITNL